MVKFYRTVKAVAFACAFVGATAPIVAQETTPDAASITIEVSDIKTTDATISITPSSADLGYFYDMKTKAAFEAAGGADAVVEKQIQAWTNAAAWYDDTTWQEMMEMNRKKGAEEFSAREFLYEPLSSATDYVVYAYALDAEGNVTVPVTTKEFTTAAPVPSANTFTITITSIEAGKFGRLNVNAKVTPTNEDNYTVQCVAKSVADDYDLSVPGSDSYKKFISDKLLYGLSTDEIVSGEQTFVFDRKVPETEYCIFVFGLDADRAVTTALTRYDFVAKETPAPVAASIALEVKDIKTTDATISITPSDDELGYFYDLKTKAAFDADGGADAVVEKQIQAWTNAAAWYDDTTWQEMMEINRKKGAEEFSAREFMYEPLSPDTKYVVYAYALDAEGNVTVPVTTKEFTTTAPVPSANTFTVTLNSVEPLANRPERVVVKATVGTTNDDTYIAQCVAKSVADKYDLSVPGSDSYKKFISSELLYGLSADEIVSGEHEFTYERIVADTDYCIFVMGLDADRAPTTTLTRYDFVTSQYPEPLPEIKLEISEISPMNAHLKVTPPSDDIYYFVDITPTSIIEEKGGIEAIPEKCIIDWWKFLESLFTDGTKWQDFIPMQCEQGSMDVWIKDLAEKGEISNLYWGGDWTVYAVGFNTEGEVVTKTAVQRFTTPKPEPNEDLTFTFEPVSMEKDEEASAAWGGRTIYTATIDIYPSDDSAPYMFNYMRTIILDQYNDEENPEENTYKFITQQFYDTALLVTDAARVVMPELDATRAGKKQEYYLIAMGWEEGPTTPIHKYTFSYDENSGLMSVTEVRDTDVIVNAGTISMIGDCDGASVYSAAGQLVGSIRSGRSISVPAGMYIVTYSVNGKQTSKKVVVK